MGFRFQSHLKLFPGVRLNFSGGGISTTIGVRGAGVTFGPRGAYAHVGIPGTGLSYRTHIGLGPTGQRPAREVTPSSEPPLVLPPEYDDRSAAGAIRSGPIGTMTSPGLDGLKMLINEAALRRTELTASVADCETGVTRASRRLRRARWFIIRLFRRGALPRLTEELAIAGYALSAAQQQLAGCSVAIDFALDELTLNGFAALVRGFEALIGCQKIWDITASVLANRVKERTTAQQRIARKLVALNFSRSAIIETNYNALFFTNANGNDIYIYPGFVMLHSPSSDFALIDVCELRLKFSQSTFIEEEHVPGDSEVIGQTWKKANVDGSRDRRFANNY